MNSYIDAQIKNMVAMVKVFEQSCEMGALRDDGKISKEEEKTLRAIHQAGERFRRELEGLK